MRCLLVVLGLAGMAAADPTRNDLLVERTRATSPEARLAAAKDLARLPTSTRVIAALKVAAISDDPDVRVILLDALVARQILPPAARLHVPTRAVLARMFPKLYPKRAPNTLPDPAMCSISSGTERAVAISCVRSRCDDDVHVSEPFEITTGVRWSGTVGRTRRSADGTCGNVRLFD